MIQHTFGSAFTYGTRMLTFMLATTQAIVLLFASVTFQVPILVSGVGAGVGGGATVVGLSVGFTVVVEVGLDVVLVVEVPLGAAVGWGGWGGGITVVVLGTTSATTPEQTDKHMNDNLVKVR